MNAAADVTLVAGWAQTERALAPLSESLSTGPHADVLRFRSVTLTSVAALLDEAPADDTLPLADAPSAYALSLASRLARGDRPATLIGWSMGGMVALETAIHFPELVARLALLSACACFCPPAIPGKAPALPVRALIVGLHRDRRETLRRFFSLVYSGTAGERSCADDLNRAMELDQKHLIHGLRYLQQIDLRPRLSTVTAPALLIHGRRDRIIAWQASQSLHAGLRGSELLLMDEADHGFVVTSPGASAATLVRFLSEDILLA